MKEGVNGKSYDSTVIPKAWEDWKSFSTPKEEKDIGVCLPDEQFYKNLYL